MFNNAVYLSKIYGTISNNFKKIKQNIVWWLSNKKSSVFNKTSLPFSNKHVKLQIQMYKNKTKIIEA